MVEAPAFSPQALRNVRSVLGISQERLARTINVSVGAVTAWENGRREPAGRYLAAIARLAEVPMEDFYDHEPEGTDPADAAPEVHGNAKSAPPFPAVSGRS